MFRLTFFLVLMIFHGYFISAQSNFTSAINVTGSSKKVENGSFKNYSFEWSIGESSLVVTLSTTNFQVSHGLLQGYLLSDPLVPENGSWFPDEIKIYPNPTSSVFNVDILSTVKGILVFQFLNSSGILVKAFNKNYYGVGLTQNFDITGFPSGVYFLKLSVLNFPGENYGSYMTKTGVFKIIKVN